MIRQKEIPRTASSQGHHSKTYPKTGHVRHAESAKNILKCGRVDATLFLY